MNTNPQMPAIVAPGVLLVLSAPSGAGKTTLAHRLRQEFPQAKLSISYTTRAPRGAEKDGVDYHFVDTTTFTQMIDKGEFVEWAQVHGSFYGTARNVADIALSSRSLVLFDIDIQGGSALKRKYPDAVLVFILPPSMDELERRLRARATEEEEKIRGRLLAARAEIERGTQTYDYLVINDQLEVAFGELKSIVIAEACRRGRVDLTRLNIQPL